jgi:hypothetical protein
VQVVLQIILVAKPFDESTKYDDITTTEAPKMTKTTGKAKTTTVVASTATATEDTVDDENGTSTDRANTTDSAKINATTAFIQLKADTVYADGKTHVFHSNGSSDEAFTLNGLQPGVWYLVNYTYTVSDPLEYSTTRVQIVKVSISTRVCGLQHTHVTH